MSNEQVVPNDDELDYLGKVLLAESEEEEEEKDKMCPEADKLDSNYAGYMELPGAKKDGGCQVVYVDGGISKDKGCCNLFHPGPDAAKFSCGTCKYQEKEE